MTPKELLDTILGYLGFVVQIDETQSEGGNPTLQIYMEESHTLIGRDGETLEAIQFLLNRLIQAKDKDAPKGDCRLRALPLDARGSNRAAGAGAGRACSHLRSFAAA